MPKINGITVNKKQALNIFNDNGKVYFMHFGKLRLIRRYEEFNDDLIPFYYI